MDEFNGSDMRELEITSEGFHIHLSKNEVSFEKPAIAKASSEKPAIEAVEDVSASEKGKASEKDDGKAIKAPMVGTIYLKPEPDKDPYVTEGMRVHKGDIVCIIEAMSNSISHYLKLRRDRHGCFRFNTNSKNHPSSISDAFD